MVPKSEQIKNEFIQEMGNGAFKLKHNVHKGLAFKPKIKDKKIDRKFAMFVLKYSEPGNPLLLHDEPIFFKDKIVGSTTSSNYSFYYKKNISLAYVINGLENQDLHLEVEGKKYPIKQNQISKLIPSVGTGGQFKYTLGDPRKVLQKLIISSIGGVINLLLFISPVSYTHLTLPTSDLV